MSATQFLQQAPNDCGRVAYILLLILSADGGWRNLVDGASAATRTCTVDRERDKKAAGSWHGALTLIFLKRLGMFSSSDGRTPAEKRIEDHSTAPHVHFRAAGAAAPRSACHMPEKGSRGARIFASRVSRVSRLASRISRPPFRASQRLAAFPHGPSHRQPKAGGGRRSPSKLTSVDHRDALLLPPGLLLLPLCCGPSALCYLYTGPRLHNGPCMPSMGCAPRMQSPRGRAGSNPKSTQYGEYSAADSPRPREGDGV